MRKLIELAKALRIVEIIGKLGFVLVGAIFAIQEWSCMVVVTLVKISMYSFICALTIFCFNSYAGYQDDRSNLRLSALFSLSKQEWLWLTLFFFGVSLLIIFVHPLPIMLTALGVLLCWAAYSLPHYGLKGIPFGGIFVSFFTEVLLFHLSYLFFAPYSFSSIVIATYFGLLVAAGHAIHELIDYEADKQTHILTTAVYMGMGRARKLPFYIFLLAFLLLVIAFAFHILPLLPIVLLSVANVTSLFLVHRLFNTIERLSFIRIMYLALYGSALAALLVSRVW